MENTINISQKNQTREDAVRQVWFYMENRWTLKDETPEHFILTRTNVSFKEHLIIAILFGWWLFFIPNIIYHLVRLEQKKISKNKLI